MSLVITLFSVSTAYAQTERDTASLRMRWEEKIRQMRADLTLTDVQADSVYFINIEFQHRRDSVFTDRHLSQDDKMPAYHTLMHAMNQRLQAVLGDDLFAKYETWLNGHTKSPNRKS